MEDFWFLVFGFWWWWWCVGRGERKRERGQGRGRKRERKNGRRWPSWGEKETLSSPHQVELEVVEGLALEQVVVVILPQQPCLVAPDDGLCLLFWVRKNEEKGNVDDDERRMVPKKEASKKKKKLPSSFLPLHSLLSSRSLLTQVPVLRIEEQGLEAGHLEKRRSRGREKRKTPFFFFVFCFSFDALRKNDFAHSFELFPFFRFDHSIPSFS